MGRFPGSEFHCDHCGEHVNSKRCKCCNTCGNSGFSGHGTGYDDVCSDCGGQSAIPAGPSDCDLEQVQEPAEPLGVTRG